MKILLVLAALAAVVLADKARYDLYRVYTVELQTVKQLEIMRMVQEEDQSYDFWNEIEQIGGSVDIMVPPHKRGEFSELMEKNWFSYQIKIQNVQELIDLEMPSVQPRAFSWESYYRVADIYAWLDEIIAANSFVSGFTAGQSYEGRLIRGVKISKNTGNPAIFIEANMHAREWISSATATFTINELITSTDPEIQALANNYDWYIIPVMNPDGLEFTKDSTRLWRKTRRPNTGSTCIGTDGNRNFDFQWMVNNGSSSNPCSETYAGPQAFSETETRTFSEFYRPISNTVRLFISYHSYGQYVLYPYGHTTSPTPNAADLDAMAAAFSSRAAVNYGTRYTYGSTSVHLCKFNLHLKFRFLPSLFFFHRCCVWSYS